MATHDGVLSRTGCPTVNVVGVPEVRKPCRREDLNPTWRQEITQMGVNKQVTAVRHGVILSGIIFRRNIQV